MSELSTLAMENSNEDEGEMRQEQNYMKDIFERLWLLLDYHYLDTRVIEGVIYFSRRFPRIFTFVIETTFQTENEQKLEQAIRRY